MIYAIKLRDFFQYLCTYARAPIPSISSGDVPQNQLIVKIILNMITLSKIRTLSCSLRPAAILLDSRKVNNGTVETLPVCQDSTKYLLTHSISSIRHLNNIISSKFSTNPQPSINAKSCNDCDDIIEIKYDNHTVLKYPKLWLRMHCQCPECYDVNSTGRVLPFKNWQTSDAVEKCNITADGNLEVKWSNGHNGEYTSSWLRSRRFKENEIVAQNKAYALPWKGWSKKHIVEVFSYNDLMNKEDAVLRWLEELEITGTAKVTGLPSNQNQGGPVLAERVGMVKRTFFGEVSNIFLVDGANNAAYTNRALDLHNDLAYNEELPGIVFLHMVKQHTGNGGDTLISDGYYAAEMMRHKFPTEFNLLANTDVYFTCSGVDKNGNREPYEYNRISKESIFTLCNREEMKTIRYSNHSIDALMEMPLEQVTPYIKAFKLYGSLLEDNCIQVRLNDGEMIVLDNTRCQHGRTLIEGNSSRHLATSYMTWDDARCRRRVLQQKLIK